MLQLRDYQRAALDALYSYWSEGGGNGLIVLPTGAGKALVIAKLIEELLSDYPDMRIANVTHSATLVRQNFEEFIGLSPFAPAGLYSASLGRRDAHAQVLFGGIQSIANKTAQLGAIDLVIVDEAHAISRNTNTLYGKFLAGVKEQDPDSRVCGTTATDYRMDSGRLTEGEYRLFDDVVYEIGIGQLMEEGYLTRLTSQKTTAKIDLKGVATRGGEYATGQLGEAAERIIEDAVAEDIAMSQDRKSALFFTASKANAEHIAEAVRRNGRTCRALTSDNSHEIDEIFEEFRSGRLWSIASVGIMTTGTNFPRVDFISLILSTKSPGKLVQILGRGTRNSPGKTDCLIADHGKNLSYHGPIDQIKPREPGSGEGEQPKKLCPDDRQDVEGKTGCGELLPISVMTCHCCGYVFPPSEEEKITASADRTPVLSTERPWFEVTGRTYAFHPGKAEKPPTVKATYIVDGKARNEWLCPQHGARSNYFDLSETGDPATVHLVQKKDELTYVTMTMGNQEVVGVFQEPVEAEAGDTIIVKRNTEMVSVFAKGKSDRYWLTHNGKRPFPKSVEEFLDRAAELDATTEVQLDYSRNTKYPDVKAYRVGAGSYVTSAQNDNAANDNALGEKKGNLAAILGRGRTEAAEAEAKEKARLRKMAEEFEADAIPF